MSADGEAFDDVVAETARLILRPWRKDEHATLHALLSDRETMRHWPEPLSDAYIKSWHDRAQTLWLERRIGRWAVVRKSDGVVVGDCGLAPIEIPAGPVTDLGYIIHADHHGQGYAAEAAWAALRYGLDVVRLTDIIVHMAEDHAASRRVAMKLGLRESGRFQNPNNKDKVHLVFTVPADTPPPDLRADLERDAGFRDAMRDGRFLRAFQALLQGRSFYKGGDSRKWRCAPHGVRLLTQTLKPPGTTEADFQHDDMGDVHMALQTHLARLGWRTETAADRARDRRAVLDRRVVVLREMEPYESRPRGETPAWALPLRRRPELRRRTFAVVPTIEWEDLSKAERDARTPGRLEDRLTALALTGRIPQDAYDDLCRRLAKAVIRGG